MVNLNFINTNDNKIENGTINTQKKEPTFIDVTKQYVTLNLRTIGVNFLKEKFSNFRRLEQDTPIATSLFGTPIYANLTIKGGTYVDLNTNQTTTYDGIILNNVLMTVNQTKNIITTAMPGRNGTVKEFASNGDYLINIKGGITIGDSLTTATPFNMDADIYPTDEVATLFKLMNVRDVIDVDSSFLNQFGITSIIVNDFSFDEQKGVRNMQIFDMNCLSDTKIILQSTKV